MKLWLLERKDFSYFETESCMVCAKTENEARKLAGENFDKEYSNEWVDSTKSICKEVSLKKSVIIHSHYATG